MKPLALIYSQVLVAFVLTACHEKKSPNEELSKAPSPDALYTSNNAPAAYDEKSVLGTALSTPRSQESRLKSTMGQQALELQSLMLSISGDISFESKDLLKTLRVLENSVFKLNGYISKNELENNYQKSDNEVVVGDSVIIRKHYKRESKLSIHIPIAFFDSLIQCIDNEALFVDERNLSATAQKIQFLRTQKSETQLVRWLTLLKQMNVKSPVKETNERSPVELLRDEISNADDASITLEEIKQKIEYAQLSLRIYEAPYVREIKQLKSSIDKQDGFFALAWQSIAKGWSGITLFLIQLLTIWPILLLLSSGVYAYKKWKKTKAEQNS